MWEMELIFFQTQRREMTAESRAQLWEALCIFKQPIWSCHARPLTYCRKSASRKLHGAQAIQGHKPQNRGHKTEGGHKNWLQNEASVTISQA